MVRWRGKFNIMHGLPRGAVRARGIVQGREGRCPGKGWSSHGYEFLRWRGPGFRLLLASLFEDDELEQSRADSG